MKAAAIYYFSGTGNTELVAEMLRDAFIQQGYRVDLLRIEDVLNQNLAIEPEKYAYIGIGSQVIGYGTPQIVYNFLRRIPAAAPDGVGKKVFLFRTAGGVAPINYNASKPVIRRLARKGYDVVYERIFAIGSNWVTRFSDDIVQQLYQATRRKTALMVEEILRGERRILKTGLGLRLAFEALMAVDPLLFRLVGKDYQVQESCNHCGLCIRRCPVKNIYEKDGAVKFRFACNGCMRCVYACPRQAIRFRRLTFFPVPGGYQIKKILNPPAGWVMYTAGKKPPFFERYVRDDSF